MAQVNVDSNSKSPLFQEWKAVSSSNEVLFYNKSTRTLESMSYSSECERFFKTIWYYLCGYTKNEDMVFQGMSKLIDRSLNEISKETFSREGELDQFLQTVKAANEVALRKMITVYNESGEIVLSLAVQQLKKSLEQFLEVISGKTVSTTVTLAEKTNVGETSNTVVSEKTQEQEAQTTQIPTPPPMIPTPPPMIPTPPPMIPTPPPMIPTPPPMIPTPPDLSGAMKTSSTMKTPEQIKKEAISKAESVIATKKQMIAYLELVGLEDTKEYKDYKNAKGNLEMYQTKMAEHSENYKNVSMTKLENVIGDIKQQISEVKTKVSIMQEGVIKEYPLPIAKETCAIWEQILEEFKTNEAAIEKYLALKEEKGKTMISHKGFDLSCVTIEEKISGLKSELAKEIEANEGKMDLKTQNSLLHNLESKLATLKGEKLEKKPSVLLKKTLSQKGVLTGSQSAQELQGGLAALASSQAAKKKSAMPNIFKIA